MAAFNAGSRSLSIGSLDGWVDAAPYVRSRKPSIDSMSSWCVADLSDLNDEWQESGSPLAPSLLDAPQGPSLAPSEYGSRRGSLASWDDALLFEREESVREPGEMSHASSRKASYAGSGNDGEFDSNKNDENDEIRSRKYSISSQFSEVNWSEEQDWRRDSMNEPSVHAPQDRNRHGSLSGEWECVRCSFMNHALLPACEMCDTPKEEPIHARAEPNQSEAVQSACSRFCPSFADVVRSSSKPIAIIPKTNARAWGQKPILSYPRVRPHVGLALMKKCERTMSASFTSSLGSKGSRSKSTSRSSHPRQSTKDKYYLPAIEGIPEEEENNDALMIFPLDQEGDDSEDGMLQALEISEEVDAFSMSAPVSEEESDDVQEEVESP